MIRRHRSRGGTAAASSTCAARSGEVGLDKGEELRRYLGVREEGKGGDGGVAEVQGRGRARVARRGEEFAAPIDPHEGANAGWWGEI